MVTGSTPGIETETVSPEAKPVPVIVVVPPATTLAGSAVIAVTYWVASTVTVVVAGLADEAPVAVTVTGPSGKSAGSVRLAEMVPVPVAVVTTGSVRPGTVIDTDSPGRNPVPVIVVLPPGAIVAGSAVIAVTKGATTRSVVAGVSEVAPVAVNVRVAGVKPAGIATLWLITPAASDVVTTGSRPGAVIVTCSFAAKPVPSITVDWPGLTVAGVAVIAVSYTTSVPRTEDDARLTVASEIAGTREICTARTVADPAPRSPVAGCTFAVTSATSRTMFRMGPTTFAARPPVMPFRAVLSVPTPV